MSEWTTNQRNPSLRSRIVGTPLTPEQAAKEFASMGYSRQMANDLAGPGRRQTTLGSTQSDVRTLDNFVDGKNRQAEAIERYRSGNLIDSGTYSETPATPQGNYGLDNSAFSQDGVYTHNGDGSMRRFNNVSNGAPGYTLGNATVAPVAPRRGGVMNPLGDSPYNKPAVSRISNPVPKRSTLFSSFKAGGANSEYPEGYADGTARIPGKDTGVDSKLIMARPGEAVVTKEAMDQPGMREFVAEMNAKHRPSLRQAAHAEMMEDATGVKHAAGGYVDDYGNLFAKNVRSTNTYAPAEVNSLYAGQKASAAAVPVEAAAARAETAAKIDAAKGVAGGKQVGGLTGMLERNTPGLAKTLAGKATSGAKVAGANAGLILEGARTGNDVATLSDDPAMAALRVSEGATRAGMAAIGGSAAFAAAPPVLPWIGPLAKPAAGLLGAGMGYIAPETTRSLISLMSGKKGADLPSEVASKKRVSLAQAAELAPAQAAPAQSVWRDDAMGGYDTATPLQNNPIDYARTSKAEAARLGLRDVGVVNSGEYGNQGGMVSGKNARGQITLVGQGNEDIRARETARAARVVEEGEQARAALDAVLSSQYGNTGLGKIALSRITHKQDEANKLAEKEIAANATKASARASLVNAQLTAQRDAHNVAKDLRKEEDDILKQTFPVDKDGKGVEELAAARAYLANWGSTKDQDPNASLQEKLTRYQAQREILRQSQRTVLPLSGADPTTNRDINTLRRRGATLGDTYRTGHLPFGEVLADDANGFVVKPNKRMTPEMIEELQRRTLK